MLNREKMVSYSIKVVPSDFKKMDGKSQLRLRIIINRKKYEIGLNIFVKSITDFDSVKQLIKSSAFNSDNYNKIIRKALQKAQQYFLECDLKEIPYSIEGFKSYYIRSEKSLNDFYTFAEKAIEEIKGLVCSESLRQYKGEITKLKKFKKTLYLHEMDVNFIRSYEQYMRVELQNKTNTVAKTLKKIKRLLNIAIDKQLIEKNPFERYKLKNEKTNRVFLNIEELAILEEIHNKPDVDVKLKSVLQCFLFSCYTGLRYNDLRCLKWGNIENNKISLIQAKTNESVYIPLIEKAVLLMPIRKSEDVKVFKIISNQKCNEYLKAISSMAGFKKSLSFHCSRHTFATVSLNLGIRFEVVSKLLGHSDLKTTKIYARLLNETTDAEMLKWNRM